MNKVKIIFFLLVVVGWNVINAFGASSGSAKQFINNADWNFVENKGQIPLPPCLTDMRALKKGEYVSKNGIKYYGHQGGVYLYCRQGMISFVFRKVEKEANQISGAISQPIGLPLPKVGSLREQGMELGFGREKYQPSKITISHADLVLIGSNPSAQILASEQQEYFENFYLSYTPEEGITHVKTYKTITYKNIYPNINFVLLSKDQGLEYEFVVYPGGNVGDIQIEWQGIETIKKLKDSGIEYSFGLGGMTETAPYTYVGAGLAPAQSEDRYAEKGDRKGHPYIIGTETKIESHFIVKNNRISFKTGEYDNAKTLVIDPFLSWGTYFGGDAFDAGNAVATDKSGNVFITGFTQSISGIAKSGAFQTSFGGANEDAYLAKFNSAGKILWATYYGGGGDDYGSGVATDNSGNVFVSGSTGSLGMATSGAYQTSFYDAGSHLDAFLAKFNGNGVRGWATYIGFGNTQGEEVAADGSGNVYIEGNSYLDGIATNGAYQTSVGSGNLNAFLAKFSNSGTIQWATYYGGKGFTISYGVATDLPGNVYITGWTNSGSGIATNAAFQTSYGGDEDAFLAKFNQSGNIQWATYYGGPGADVGAGVATDKSGNVLITGNTTSLSGIATSGAYQTSYNGDSTSGDIFLAKFNSNGALWWATYYGGANGNHGQGVSADEYENIFVTGYTSSFSGISTTGAFQTTNGNPGAFLSEFNNTGNLQWATYYGFEDVAGNGVASDGSGNVYIVGSAGRLSGGIATSGAYQTSVAGSRNAFLAKFNFRPNNDAGIGAIYYGDTSNICAGKQPVNVTLVNYGNNNLDSADISWIYNGILQKPYHWTTSHPLPHGNITSISIGTILFSVGKKDTIIAWTSMPNGQQDSVPQNDTSTTIINVLPLPVANAGFPKIICEYDSVAIGSVGIAGNIYSWTSNPVETIPSLSNPTVFPLTSTTYYLTQTIIATGCRNSDTVTITVNPAPPAITGPNKAICKGDTITIGDVASVGFTYNWKSSPSGFSSTISNPSISPSSTTNYTLTETNSITGCAHSNSVQIKVNPLPVATVGLNSYSICNGTHIKIGANAQPGIAYLWSSSPIGFSSTLSNPVVDPGAYTQYFLNVIDTATGCVNKNFSNVSVSILKAPLINVGKNQAVCVGVSAQIGSTTVVGYKYAWTSNPTGFTSTTANPVVTPMVTSSYSLTVTDVHSCTNFDSVTVKVNPRPHPNTGSPQNACSGTIIKLGEPNDTSLSYSWTSNPKGFGSKLSDPVDSPKVSTEYYLKETISTTGCTDSDSVKITVVPRPNIAFDVKNINGFGYQFIIKNPNYSNWQYHWNFGDTVNMGTDTASGHKVSHTYSLNGSYTVVLTISLPGFCTEIDSYNVVINESAFFNIFPNPFGLQTDIRYVLLSPGHVRITMTDAIGRYIGTLVDKQYSPGEYNTIFDAGPWETRPGVYFVIFQLDDKVTVKEIVQINSIFY